MFVAGRCPVVRLHHAHIRPFLRVAPPVLALALLVSAAGLTIRAQQNAAPPPAIDAQAVLPIDPAIRTGTLPNGLKYFIRRNGRPEKRVSLRLAIKSGSLEEADDQQGLAHLIEHMAFNGSTHFKPGELVSYFERLGARLGPHVNAYTSFDETVYMLDLPTDQGDVVAKGLTALSDFAGGLNLDPAEIDKERGVVIEEWRGGLGAGSRVRDKQIPIIFYNSRYADRLPIGKPDIIRNAPAARLRAFYDTWYRPGRDGGHCRRRHRSARDRGSHHGDLRPPARPRRRRPGSGERGDAHASGSSSAW